MLSVMFRPWKDCSSKWVYIIRVNGVILISSTIHTHKNDRIQAVEKLSKIIGLLAQIER